MAFESPIEKFLLVSFIVLALVAIEISTGFFSHLFQPPAPKEKISASNYPNYIVKEEIPSEKLVLTYNPELAIVSPDRTPFIDLVLKIKNEQDVPRTLKLVFPDPATLLTDDPRFVVAHTTFKDENTDQTYHRLVLFLPENAEKEVKIRYENAYAALDDLKHDVTLELYNEDDQKVADITYRLRSVVLGFWDVWTLPTMPIDKKEVVLWTGKPAITGLDGEFIRWKFNDDCTDHWRYQQYSAEIPLGGVSGTLKFTYRAYTSNGSRSHADYFRVKVYSEGTWKTVYDCNADTCALGWKTVSVPIDHAEKVKFEAYTRAYDCDEVYIIVKDLSVEGASSTWHAAYAKTEEAAPNCGSNACETSVVVDVPDGKYRGFLVYFWSDRDYEQCLWDWVRIYVYDGSDWQKKWEKDMGDFCGGLRAWLRQPVWIDTLNIEQVNQVKVVWRHKSNPYLYAKVYMVPYDFPNTVFFEEVCDENTTHTLQLQTNGEFGVLQFPQNSCTTLKKQTVGTVHIKATYESQTTELNLPVFYDPDKSDDLLWRMYEQWKSGLEVNGQ